MVGDQEQRRYLEQVTAAAGDPPDDRQRAVLAAVATALGSAHGVDLDRTALGAGPVTASVPPPPTCLARPELLGEVYEALRPRELRRSNGAFYTPPAVARHLADVVLQPLAGDPARVRVCDPAAGGGAFLLAAVRHLAARGADPATVVRYGVHAMDVDPLAMDVTEAALTLLAGPGAGPPPRDHLVVGDALTHVGVPDHVDAVIGNPPFLNQLSAVTARSAPQRRALAARFGSAVAGYADTALVFLLLGLDLVRDGGRVGLILPASFLSARDAGPARRAVAERAALDLLWTAEERLFDAAVRVCAPVLTRGGHQGAVARRVGAGFTPSPPVPIPRAKLRAVASWGFLAAGARGVPAVAPRPGARPLGDYCRATADFRDQFYGLVPYVREEEAEHADEHRYPRLVTSGLIDPARLLWSCRTTRFAKRTFIRPRVDVEHLRRESTLASWSTARQVPKVLVATQTRVLEAVVDEAGDWLPCTPVITVEAAPERLWHLAAALHAPPLSALALRGYAGAALSADAIKLSARQLLCLPAPAEGDAWDDAADALRAAAHASDEATWRAHLHTAGRAGCRAYGVEETGLLDWWTARLPPWRGGPRP